MKSLGIIFLTVLITGCAALDQKTPMVVKTEVIKMKIPESLMEVPPYPKKIDVETATQADVSKFIAETEKRMYELERKLEEIKKFNDVPVEKLDGSTK
jgi:hypothetical protein